MDDVGIRQLGQSRLVRWFSGPLPQSVAQTADAHISRHEGGPVSQPRDR